MRNLIVFYDPDGNEIFHMSVKGMCEGEISATIGLLAYERGIPEASISFAEVTR